ncbi:hypothetical protein [Gilvimarinus chinensis]|uniref:hypothetical protein n=1 Tax=Gilvimarinus chinensis TaxID=396005 RepID=UPI00035C8888|nr:hypothetical protein [Gilvimarinus chinensis]
MKSTSRQAYAQKDPNKSTRDRMDILDFVEENPGCTRQEISRHFKRIPINVCCPRVNELLASKALVERGLKRDSVSGKSCYRLYVNEEAGAAA